jgi:signal transduction histidine kinase
MVIAAATTSVSRHKCLIYDGDPSEQLPVVVPLLLDALRQNERCLYLGDPATIAMIQGALTERDVDVRREMQRGALVFSSERGPEDAPFDPPAMVAMLVEMIDTALRDGFTGLCATGDMRWELGSDRNFERLLEYEALLEQVFPKKPLRGICQYHRATVPRHAIRDALLAHRSLYVGTALLPDNHFYIPPELLLREREQSERLGEWMCQQLIRIMDAERTRDRALDALRASEAEQRRLAEHLAELNRDLEQRVKDRTAALEAVNQELEAFSYSVSHDLRAPLRHMSGFVQLLERHAGERLDQTARRYMDTIGGAARTMGTLIDDLLTFSRLSRTALQVATVDLDTLMAEVREALGPDAQGRRIEWTVNLLPVVQADRALLRQVFLNLLGNAVKYTRGRDPARIEVRADRRGAEHVVAVRDNGVGFDMQYAHKLFSAFQRLHTDHEFEGTGIGLAIVRRIVARHGGRVWAEGARGVGATFYVSLPEDRPAAAV